MAEWKRTIAIKQHLDPGAPLESVQAPIVAVLKRDPAYVDDYEFIEVVDRMSEAVCTEDFDEALSELYDWADYQRVWIGGGDG